MGVPVSFCMAKSWYPTIVAVHYVYDSPCTVDLNIAHRSLVRCYHPFACVDTITQCTYIRVSWEKTSIVHICLPLCQIQSGGVYSLCHHNIRSIILKFYSLHKYIHISLMYFWSLEEHGFLSALNGFF